MKHPIRILAVSLVLALVSAVGNTAHASCCGVSGQTSSACCNIFACNCDGPCTNFGCKCGKPTTGIGLCGTCPNYNTYVNSSGTCQFCSGAGCGSTAKTPPESGEAQSVPTTIASGDAKARFKAADKNGDGLISRDEARAWVKSNGGADWNDDLFNTRFKATDKDSNGKIEPAEFDASLGKDDTKKSK